MKPLALLTDLTALSCLALATLLLSASPAFAEDPNTLDPSLTQVVESDEEIATPGTPATITAGHVDLGPKFIEGKWTFLARDDTSGHPQWRHIDDVVFQVSDTAQLDLPEEDTYSFIHAQGPVWAIPQSEIAEVVWLGWNTQDPEVVSRLTQGATLVFEGHQGEGDFHAFVEAGNFSGPQELWNSRHKTAQPIHIDTNTHAHANWVFTQPGIHLIRLSLQAQLSDGTNVEDTQVLRFAVGNNADIHNAREAAWTQAHAPEAPAQVEEPSALDTHTALPLYLAAGLGIAALGLFTLVFIVQKRSRSRELAAEKIIEGEK